MSGGSYNYLYTKDVDDLFSSGIGDLKSMVQRLAEMGYEDAAKEADILFQEVIHARIVINNRMKRLSSVFRAVEWRDSGDVDDDEVKRVVEEWRKVQ